jgi:ATP-binding cassette subfamily B protein
VLLADKVALLQDGTITHVGSHSDLLAEVPAYRNLLAADADDEDAELSSLVEDEGVLR